MRALTRDPPQHKVDRIDGCRDDGCYATFSGDVEDDVFDRVLVRRSVASQRPGAGTAARRTPASESTRRIPGT